MCVCVCALCVHVLFVHACVRACARARLNESVLTCLFSFRHTRSSGRQGALIRASTLIMVSPRQLIDQTRRSPLIHSTRARSTMFLFLVTALPFSHE